MKDARTESVLPNQSSERARSTACWPAWKHGTVAALLTGLVVLLDVTWPSLSIFYFLPALYVAWAMRGRAEWILFGALTVTVLFAPFLSAPNRVSAKGTLNRTLGVCMGLFMAYLIWNRRRFSEHLQRSNEQLEARVEERSAELNATIDRLRQSDQELRQHLAELTVLNRMGVICSEVSTEDELLHRATTLITETLFPDNCGFLLLDADRSVLVTHPSFVLSDPTVSRADKALGTGITGQVALTGHTRRVGEVSQEPGYLAADSTTRSELCIPMQIGSKVVGVLNVESRKPKAFSDIDEQLASTIVDLVSNALERLRAEEQVRQSQQFLRSITLAFPNWVYIFDFDTQGITYTNRSILGDLGYSSEVHNAERSLEQFAEYMPPEEWSHLAKVLGDWQALADGQLRDDEYQLRHADGTTHSFVGRETVFTRRPDGSVRQVLGTLSDITTRKQAEAATRLSEQHFALFMQHLPGLAWIKDDQGRYVFANAAAEKAFGISLSHLFGKTDGEIFPPETAAQFQATDRQALASGTEVRTVEVLEHGDGVLHHSIVSKFSLPNSDGQALLVGGVAIDITEHKQAEETIRKISAFRETIVRTAAEGICVCSSIPDFPHVCFSVWNDQMTELTGYTMDEINRLGWYQTMYPDPDVQQRAIHRMSAMRDGNDMRAEEWEITRKDGARRTLSISISIVETDSNTHGVVAMMQDVTERKHAAEALRESEARYRLIAELASSFSYQATVTADHQVSYQWVGGKFQEVTGYQPEELSGPGWFALIPQEDLPSILEQVAGLRSPESDLSEALEVRIRTRTGELRWIRSVVHVESPAKLGEPITVYGAVLDITERKQTETALRESEDRFQSFMNQSPVVAWAKDEEFRYRYVNAAFEQLFQLTASQILGRMDNELYPQEFAEVTRVNDLNVRNSRQILDTIECVPGADGRPRQWLVQKFPLDRSGQPLWVGGTAVDVTARLEAEAASRESERRLNFALKMSQTGAWELNLQDHKAYRTLLQDRIFGYETLLPNWSYEMFLEHVLLEDRPAVDQSFREAIAKQTDWNFECRIRRVDGEVRWIWASGGHEHSLIGEPTRMSGVVRDITRRKLVQEELQQSQKQFQQLFQSSPLATLLYSATDGRIADVNLRFLEMFQFRLEEVIGRTGPELNLWCDLAARDRMIEQLQRGQEVRNFEVRLRSKGGLEYDMLLSSLVIELPTGSMVIVQANDITERKQSQVALTLFRTLLDHCNDGFEIINPDTGQFLDVNDQACWSHGYTREEYLALTVPQIDPLVGERPWEETRQELYRSGFAILDTLHRRKDGSVFPVEVSASLIRLDRDYFLAVVRDITERKRAAEALRQSEEQYRVILETLPVGVLIHDGQQMYYANPKAAQILGVQHPDELSRIDPMGIVAPEYRELARGRLETTLRTGNSLPSIEVVVLRIDGSRVNVEVTSRRTHFAGRDCMQVLFHDITDRKHAEETIQRILDGIAPTTGQEFFSTLAKYLCDVCGVEIAMTGAIVPDHPHEVQTIACSRRGQPIDNLLYDTRGTPCEHVIGKTLCFYPAKVQEKFPQDHLLVEMGIDSYLGIPLWSSHGEALGLIVLLNDRPFPDPVQTQVILQVVAARCGAELERQQAEQRLRENEERLRADLSLRQRNLLHASRLNAIGQMVAGLSHEVAQPLNAISNFAVASTRLLDSDTSGTPDTLREYVQAIVVQSQRCAAILRRLRDFSRRTPTVKTACDLNSLLIESVELIASETRRKHARVQLDLATGLPQISADRVQIQQVVFNLLNNALEAIQDQEIKTRLMTIRSRAETNSVIFEVEDHGSGITPEVVQQLFEPFFTTKHDGMGIGLNICETIVRDHGGRIEVESNEYRGATFRVHLPFPREDGSISEQIPGVVQ